MATIQPETFIARVIENLIAPKIEQQCEQKGICQTSYGQLEEFVEDQLGYCFPRFQSVYDEGKSIPVYTEEGHVEFGFTEADMALCAAPAEGQKGLLRFNVKLALKDKKASGDADASDAAAGADAQAGEAVAQPYELKLTDASFNGVEAAPDPLAKPPVLPATREAMEDVHACAIQKAYYGDWNLDGIDDLIIIAGGNCYNEANQTIAGAKCMDLYVLLGFSPDKATGGDRFKYGKCVEEVSHGGGCSVAPTSYHSGPSAWDEAVHEYRYLWHLLFD